MNKGQGQPFRGGPMPGQGVALPILPSLDARIPKWSLDQLRFRRCPLCQSDNPARLLRPDRLPVAFCAGCQLWYVSGLPPLEEIQKLYQGYWFSFRPRDLSESYAAYLHSDKDRCKEDIRLKRLSALSGGLAGKCLLEIGCGCGEFLVGARQRGALVFGNDVSEEACSFVRDRLGVRVWPGQLSDSGFCAEFGPMDIVVMSDLIEHPAEPLRMFESALNVLKVSGLVLMLTPNGGAAPDDPERAAQWIGFRVDLDHLQYLSVATVSTLAARYNCRIEHLETFGYPYLKGIDRPAACRAAALRSPKQLIKAQLERSRLTRGAVLGLRALLDRWAGRKSDPRSGTYHLVAILRKLPEHREARPAPAQTAWTAQSSPLVGFCDRKA